MIDKFSKKSNTILFFKLLNKDNSRITIKEIATLMKSILNA
jgi:hypothetical protein